MFFILAFPLPVYFGVLIKTYSIPSEKSVKYVLPFVSTSSSLLCIVDAQKILTLYPFLTRCLPNQ